MDRSNNSVYYDSKNLEGACLLKIAYDLFPRGRFLSDDLYKKVDRNATSILRWRSEAFPGAEYMSDASLSNCLYNEERNCISVGLISRTGTGSAAFDTIEKDVGYVKKILKDPWRSTETNVEKFSRGDGMPRRSDVAYLRDVLLQAMESHGFGEKSMDEFFGMEILSERIDYSQTNMVNILYRSGFLELMGRLRHISSASPTFAPFKIRLKGEAFDPVTLEKLRASGYISRDWDGILPKIERDVDALREMVGAVTFSTSDFDVERLFRLGYLERTSDYLNPQSHVNYGPGKTYRVRKDLADAISAESDPPEN